MNFQDHSLTLGLGFPPQTLKTNNHNHHITSPKPKHEMILGDNEQPYLTLSLSSESATSLPNVVLVSSVKRERETTSSDDVDIERGSSRNISDEEEDGTCNNITATRKKLRLTKDQSAMLEESFMLQNTLNPKQKQVLADRLNMRPRQVEVWFQNRRARTKSKKTEEDCEYMKKWCETLTDENMRLSKELEGLKLTQPYFMQLPTTTTLTMCPSCERIGSTVPISGTPPISNNHPFVAGSNKTHFYAATTSSNRPLLVDN